MNGASDAVVVANRGVELDLLSPQGTVGEWADVLPSFFADHLHQRSADDLFHRPPDNFSIGRIRRQVAETTAAAHQSGTRGIEELPELSRGGSQGLFRALRFGDVDRLSA